MTLSTVCFCLQAIEKQGRVASGLLDLIDEAGFSHILFAQSFVISASLFVSELRFAEGHGHELVVQTCWVSINSTCLLFRIL